MYGEARNKRGGDDEKLWSEIIEITCKNRSGD